jgi:hypothetical protein
MTESKFAPIALFTYCRPWHTQKTVEALLANHESSETDLYIFSDAPKNEKAIEGVLNTRKYIHTITGFKNVHIIEREKNWGLANSLIDGISKIVNEYGKVIVVEDDIVASPFFLQYMNEGLELYKNDNKVASIHAYVYPTQKKLPETFFIQGADCWGWATWKRAWDIFNSNTQELLDEIVQKKLQRKFDFDYTYPYVDMLKDQINGKVNSWAIRWYASAFLKDMYTLYPGQAMAKQIGMDGVGATHSGKTDIYNVELRMTPISLKQIHDIKNSPEGYEAFKSFFKKIQSKRMKIIYLLRLIKGMITH